eukprot:4735058-Amphidinium_carterae.1
MQARSQKADQTQIQTSTKGFFPTHSSTRRAVSARCRGYQRLAILLPQAFHGIVVPHHAPSPAMIATERATTSSVCGPIVTIESPHHNLCASSTIKIVPISHILSVPPAGMCLTVLTV